MLVLFRGIATQHFIPLSPRGPESAGLSRLFPAAPATIGAQNRSYFGASGNTQKCVIVLNPIVRWNDNVCGSTYLEVLSSATKNTTRRGFPFIASYCFMGRHSIDCNSPELNWRGVLISPLGTRIANPPKDYRTTSPRLLFEPNFAAVNYDKSLHKSTNTVASPSDKRSRLDPP